MKRTNARGFTLLELMIVVSIVAILAAVAIPSYKSSIRKSKRSDALAEILRLQQEEEKWRVNNAAYAAINASTALTASGPATTNYNFTTTSAATTYTITATAKTGNDQANDEEAGTTCTPLSIDQSNAKSPAACWRTN